MPPDPQTRGERPGAQEDSLGADLCFAESPSVVVNKEVLEVETDPEGHGRPALPAILTLLVSGSLPGSLGASERW